MFMLRVFLIVGVSLGFLSYADSPKENNTKQQVAVNIENNSEEQVAVVEEKDSNNSEEQVAVVEEKDSNNSEEQVAVVEEKDSNNSEEQVAVVEEKDSNNSEEQVADTQKNLSFEEQRQFASFCTEGIDSKIILKCLTQLADKENAIAALTLAVLYYRGVSVVYSNHKKSFEWLKKAVEFKYVKAAEQLGRYYLEGIGTQASCEKAIPLFEVCAKQDASKASLCHFNLAKIHYNGCVAEENYHKQIDLKASFHHYLRAAELQLPNAYMQVAIMYARGYGTSIDTPKAMHYFEKAEAFYLEKRAIKESMLKRIYVDLFGQAI